ncbi:hypothetical protein HBI17_254190 [Parastagonospora nodorum]|nr:hypothetical protein HBI17_254190 [Parastagonospora nodorum]KAH5990903.1 hypothetical protein HBI83_258320 [Parastagonospora nodorum]
MATPSRRGRKEARGLPYTDPRSPRFYELRAGYPPCEASWYRNTQSDNSSLAMEFSQERFVCGFNLTLGGYFRIWNIARDYMVVNNRYALNFATNRNAKYELWTLFEQIYMDEDLRTVTTTSASSKWAFDIVWSMIFSAKKYVSKHKASFDVNRSWPLSQWKFGPNSQTPEEHSDLVMQYQHLAVRVTLIARSPPNILASAAAHSTPVLVTTIRKFKSTYLLESAALISYVVSPRDIDPQRYRFHRLVQR